MSETRNWHPAAPALADFSLGKLPPEESALVARHLETCADCRQALGNHLTDSLLRRGQEDPASVKGTVFTPSAVAAARELAAPLADTPPELLQSKKYQILGKLGQGGMGTVFKANHVSMDRTVAIKVMSPDIVGNPEAARRFQQEVRAAAQLSHPNIVVAHDHDQLGELHFLVMEYIEGMSLQRYIDKHGPLPVEQACHFVRQAALGLQHAHEKGMVHRDIKPANLMVTRKGLVKVLDFGLARLSQSRGSQPGGTGVYTFMGTPEYVAPEQAWDARSADIRADLYSLGCTFYFLLTGSPPFRKANITDTVTAHLKEPPPPLKPRRPELPDVVEALVMKMLAKAPADRPQTPAEVAVALEPFATAAKTKAGTNPVPDLPAGRATEGGETVRPPQAGRGTQVAPRSQVLPLPLPRERTETPPTQARAPQAAPPPPPDSARRWILPAALAAILAAVVLPLLVTAVVLIALKSQPTNTGETPKDAGKEAPKDSTSVVGTWDCVFRGGPRVVFVFESDFSLVGTNGYRGRWEQSERTVTVRGKGPGKKAKVTVWKGEIDPTGNTLSLANDQGGAITCARKSH